METGRRSRSSRTTSPSSSGANTAPQVSPPRDHPVGIFLFGQILHGIAPLATDIYTLRRRKFGRVAVLIPAGAMLNFLLCQERVIASRRRARRLAAEGAGVETPRTLRQKD
jgi:hypothetical protein